MYEYYVRYQVERSGPVYDERKKVGSWAEARQGIYGILDPLQTSGNLVAYIGWIIHNGEYVCTIKPMLEHEKMVLKKSLSGT